MADPSDPAVRRTLRLSVQEGSLWAVMMGFGETYIAPFAIFLKAGNTLIGLLATLPPFLGSLSQMFMASRLDRFASRGAAPQLRVRFIVWLVVLQSLALLPLFFGPLAFPEHALPIIIACTALYVVSGQGAGPIWTSLMGDIVPPATRGSYFGRRSRTVIVALFVATMLAGAVLDYLQNRGRPWLGFGLLFSIAALARLASSLLLALHAEPPYRPSRDDAFSFWDFVRRTPRSNFARFTFFTAAFVCALNVAGPFYSLFQLRDLKWTYWQFTVNAAVGVGAQCLFFPWWGRMSDRYGNRKVLVASCVILQFLPLLWAIEPSFWFAVLVIQTLAGAGFAGLGLATQNFMYDAVSPGKRARVVSYSAVIHGCFTFIGGSVIGAVLADHLPSVWNIGPWRVVCVSSLPAVFVVSALLRSLVCAALIRSFSEVREVEHIRATDLLLRLTGLPALAGLLGETLQEVGAAILPEKSGEEKEREGE